MNTAAKLDKKSFNKLFWDRASYLEANLEKAKLQDLVLVLTMFRIRISHQSPGSRYLMSKMKEGTLIKSIAERLCRGGMIEGAEYEQVESLMWVFAQLEDAATEFPVLLTLLNSKIEEISTDDPHSLFASAAATTLTIRIAKSLFLLFNEASSERKGLEKESYKNFFGAITHVVKNEKRFRKVM